MRNRLIGLVSTMVLASTMATAACSSSSGGKASSSGGQQSAGGAATGGSGAAIGGSGTATGGSSGNGTVTTLSGTKVLNALTAAEVTQLCSDTYAYYASAISPATACKWKGVYFATQSSAPTEAILKQNCLNQETPCLANPGAIWATPVCPDLPTDCTSTVADYSNCIKDVAASFNQSVATVPDCDTFTSASWNPVWAIVGDVATCSFCSYYPADPRVP